MQEMLDDSVKKFNTRETLEVFKCLQYREKTLNFGKESTSEEGRCFVLYEELKSIENLIEGNEYFDGGVSYCVGIDKIDGAVSLDFAIKKCLLEMEAIVSSEMKIVITPIKYPRDEIKNLCTEWHLNEQICNKMLSLIDEDTKLYRCCDDYEYISKGVIGEIFRIIEKGQERILVDFYVVDQKKFQFNAIPETFSLPVRLKARMNLKLIN